MPDLYHQQYDPCLHPNAEATTAVTTTMATSSTKAAGATWPSKKRVKVYIGETLKGTLGLISGLYETLEGVYDGYIGY